MAGVMGSDKWSATVTRVRINLYTNLDHSDSAVEVGLEYLFKDACFIERDFLCRFKKFFLNHFCELCACRIDRLFASLRAKGQLLRPEKLHVRDAHEAQQISKMRLLGIHRLCRTLAIETTAGLDDDGTLALEQPHGAAFAVLKGDPCARPRYWDKAAVTIDEGVPLVLATSASNAVLSDAGIVITRFAIRFSAVKSACVRPESIVAEKLGPRTLDVIRVC
jgi:hypothetical protein